MFRFSSKLRKNRYYTCPTRPVTGPARILAVEAHLHLYSVLVGAGLIAVQPVESGDLPAVICGVRRPLAKICQCVLNGRVGNDRRRNSRR